jgi:hypothetical protein
MGKALGPMSTTRRNKNQKTLERNHEEETKG